MLGTIIYFFPLYICGWDLVVLSKLLVLPLDLTGFCSRKLLKVLVSKLDSTVNFLLFRCSDGNYSGLKINRKKKKKYFTLQKIWHCFLSFIQSWSGKWSNFFLPYKYNWLVGDVEKSVNLGIYNWLNLQVHVHLPSICALFYILREDHR